MSHSVLVRRSLTAVGHCRVVLYSAETRLCIYNDRDVCFLNVFIWFILRVFVERNEELWR